MISSGKVASIRDSVKSKIIGLVKSIPADRKVLIVDASSIRTLDAACSMNEILENGVYLVEVISKGRQPYPSMDAIYLVQPSEENISSIIQDFSPPKVRLASGRKGPAYKSCHLLFTRPIEETAMERLAKSPAANYIETLLETNLDFCGAESKSFYLGEGSFGRLFRPGASISGSPSMGISGGATTELERMAQQLTSLFTTMGEVPSIRYRSAKGDNLSNSLAVILQRELQVQASKHSSLRQGSATLLIMDRTVDLLSPLLHEFTIQAMGADILTDRGLPWRYEFNYDSSKRVVSLDENDQIWAEIRHVHMANSHKRILDRYNRFIAENPAAVREVAAKKGGPEAAKMITSSESAVTNLGELREKMGALGEYREMKELFSLHTSLGNACMEILDRKKLIEIAELEQNMVTGLDAQGEPVSNLWPMLTQFLDRPTLSDSDRARLVMLWILTQPAIPESEVKALLEHARLSREDGESLRTLRFLHSTLGGAPLRQRQANISRGSKRKSLVEEEPDFDVSRFVPAVKMILDDAVFGDLDSQEFTTVGSSGSGDRASTQSSGSASGGMSSLRSKFGIFGAGQSSPASGIAAPPGGPIFAFVIGGMTWSEVRSVYELSDVRKREFYIGSDQVISPTDFLQNLRMAGKK